ncbi:endonuclease domain-containing protein [Capnocytophaga granulosa]|uniref:endonuclease domain-containing protein n=1 Tax=Capnocytophaga granulosa TaxID=45242 RepID=UPI003C780CDC
MINSNIIPYNPKLKEFANNLRNNSTPCEISLWKQIKGRSLGVLFNRQVPILEYIVDFYCPQLHLAIEVDGNIHDFKYIEDAKRQEAIEKYGITFLRFSNQSIENDITHVISVIVTKINELKEEQESNY